MERLAVTLRITLDQTDRPQESRITKDTAFFILGLVHALLIGRYGSERCTVEMESATGFQPAFIRSMNSFARRHKEALDALEARGEVFVKDHDLLEVFEGLHEVVVTREGDGWRVALVQASPERPGSQLPRRSPN